MYKQTRQTIIWTNDGLFSDAYMRHSASMSYFAENVNLVQRSFMVNPIKYMKRGLAAELSMQQYLANLNPLFKKNVRRHKIPWG